MGKPKKGENETKIAAADKAVDMLIEQSTPGNNKCTEKKVLEEANKMIASQFKGKISRSTLLQSENPGWMAVNKRIQDHKEFYGMVKKAADEGLKKRVKGLEELCRNQNTKLMEYLTHIEKLEMEKVENEKTISDLVDELRDLEGKG